jgi:hypothetical protein
MFFITMGVYVDVGVCVGACLCVGVCIIITITITIINDFHWQWFAGPGNSTRLFSGGLNPPDEIGVFLDMDSTPGKTMVHMSDCQVWWEVQSQLLRAQAFIGVVQLILFMLQLLPPGVVPT